MKDFYTIKLLSKMEQYSCLMGDDGMPAYIIYYKDAILFEFEARPITGFLKKDVDFDLEEVIDFNMFKVENVDLEGDYIPSDYEIAYKALKNKREYVKSYGEYEYLDWFKYDDFLKNEFKYINGEM
ncbi:hypothetical protein [Staphylococcus phage vB_StaM_SA1]|nr:hypothetical protein [Staphylococcus phage vB_StaM_SA1]